jgi:mRNA interferase RelE/StbE
LGGREEEARFGIAFTPRARRELEQLLKKSDESVKRRFLGKADLLAENPISGKPLKGQLKGQFSLRFGDYRIIYVIDYAKKEVIVTSVGPRGRIYSR